MGKSSSSRRRDDRSQRRSRLLRLERLEDRTLLDAGPSAGILATPGPTLAASISSLECFTAGYAVASHGTAHGKVIAAAQSTSPEISVTSSVHSTAFTAASIAQFASTAIGQNVAETFTISNPAAAALVLTGNTPVAISGPQAADFQVTQPSVTAIAPGQNATFSIVFSPQGTGTRTATATIASNASGAGSFRISLKGAGLAPAIYAVRSTQFGQAAVGQTVTRTLAIYNTGTAPLVLTGSTPVTIAGPQAGDYQVKQPSVTTIAPGGHTSFTISFSPQNSGTRTATATIASNATGAGAWQVALSGTGLAPVISMAGSGQFGQVMAGQKATQSFSISNRGSAMLQMTGNPLIQITGPQASDFQVTVQPYSAKIAPDGVFRSQSSSPPRAKAVVSQRLRSRATLSARARFKSHFPETA